MIPLQNQEQLEELINMNKDKPQKGISIIYFTASWCSACKRLDFDQIIGLSNKINWYKCNVDENDYSPGYCGVKTIPAFLAILNGKPQPLFSNSDTSKVINWIKSGFI